MRGNPMRDHFEHEIRTLATGDKITEPGFYAIRLDRHHNQPCDGYSVTSSTLRTVELRTPADVWAFHPLNPDRYEPPDSTAMRLGRAMAALVEGGLEELEKVVLVLPKNKPNRPMQSQIDAYRRGKGTEAGTRSIEFWAKMDADPRDKITEEQWELLVTMGKELANDPAACAALGGIPEVTMAWQDDRTGIWCLARPDQISFSGMLSDYKKVNTQGRPFNSYVCDGRIMQHGYDMQMAFAAQGFEQLTHNWPDQVGLVFQWDQAPHHVILREIDDEDLRIGEFRNNRALRTIQECMELGRWPGPGEHVGKFIRNKEQRERLLEEMNVEGVAP